MTRSSIALTPPAELGTVGARLRGALGGQSGMMAALALLIGAGAGLGAIVFRLLIGGFTELFSGHSDPSALGHFSNPHLAFLGPFVVLVVPVIGGLLYGPLVYRLAPEARGHGVPEVMLAVHSNQGRIRGRVPIVKSVASAICIGAGGSVGREGPIVQIGSAIGSAAGQVARLPGQDLRLLVACGAAGGIGATFNAPIAGVFFALELILRDFQSRAFGIVVLSSVVATAVGRLAYGSGAFLHLPGFHVVSALEYPLYALLGIFAAVAGVAFVRTLYGAEDFADDIWRGPAWLRPAVGGILLGVLLLALPEMYGVGYPVLEGAIDGRYVFGLLLVFLLGKIVATSLTLAIGGSGGVFAPSLFMGAMLGSAFGLGAHDLLPASTAGAGAYGLVGMGAQFAATGRAPITAVLIVFELTGDYSIILPLMLAVVVATAISRRLSADSIYTLKLRRRGIDIERPAIGGPLAGLRIGERCNLRPGRSRPTPTWPRSPRPSCRRDEAPCRSSTTRACSSGSSMRAGSSAWRPGPRSPTPRRWRRTHPRSSPVRTSPSRSPTSPRTIARRFRSWLPARAGLSAGSNIATCCAPTPKRLEPEASPGGGGSAKKAEEARRESPVALVSGSEDP